MSSSLCVETIRENKYLLYLGKQKLEFETLAQCLKT
jgi:hypothetical protein